MARGVAYGTNSPAHVLNVPAGRMGASPEDPEGFIRFARSRDPSLAADAFLPRRLYGDYLEHFLAEAERAAAPDVTLERRIGEITALERCDSSRTVHVSGTPGWTIVADRVVLALGNYPPEDPVVEDLSFYASGRYIRDPWARGALDAIDRTKPVLLIGTGLTMLDIALEIARREFTPPLLAISRHGLLSQAHRPAVGPPGPHHRPPALQGAPPTALNYLRAIRRHVADLADQGEDWRPVLDSIRPLTPSLWQTLSVAERGRFLRHLRPFWEVHRHRAAPAAAKALQEMLTCGKLQIRAARVLSFDSTGASVRAHLRQRGKDKIEAFDVGTVVNCTGPCSDVRTLPDPLIAYLRERGMIRPDPLGLGLETSDDGMLLDAAGKASPLLYYVGPLLKGKYWESTAVPELRVHASRLAATLATSLGSCTSPRSSESPGAIADS
jgi:uncharacterized NAD(P)/FAD-binding protein YdhS